MMFRRRRRRRLRLARAIRDGLRELLDLQDRTTTIELNLDGANIAQSLHKIKARSRRDPTPRLARRARAKRRRP